MEAKRTKPFILRKQSTEELNMILQEHQAKLSSLRINKVTSGVASMIGKIKGVRKGIARILTVINQKRRDEFRRIFTSRVEIKKFNEENKTSYTRNRLPKMLRPRKTRALRKALTSSQVDKKLLKTIKKQRAYPLRKYFVKS